MQAITFPLNSTSQGPEVLNLQEALIALLNQNIIQVDIANPGIEPWQQHGLDLERSSQRYGEVTAMIIGTFQTHNQLLITGEVDTITAERLNGLLRPLGLLDTNNQVNGRIFLDQGFPATSLPILLYTKNLGGTETLLQTTTTNDQGAYTLSYIPTDSATNIEIRTVNAQGTEISLSNPKFNPEKREVLNLIVPSASQTLTPEHDRLSTALTTRLGEIALSTVDETADRQDITLLNQATGWDARLISLAATASKLATTTQIPEKALYGLFRTGLPTDQAQIALLNPATVDIAIAKAEANGIVTLTAEEKTATKTAIQNLALTSQSNFRSAGALSSIGEFVQASKALTLLSDTQTTLFETTLLNHEGTAESFWQEVEAQGIPTNGLKLQGKLAYLTMNNAGLTTSLYQELGSVDNLGQLVNLGLHKEAAWDSKLRSAVANNDEALKAIIPPAFGDQDVSVNDRLLSYTQHLSQIVRMTYPTQVLSHTLGGADGLQLSENHDTLHVPVQNFLQAALQIDDKFQLGGQNLDAFIKQHEDAGTLFANVTPETKTDTIKAVKTLQRLYQITPSHNALEIISRLGFTSAHDITLFPFSEFIEKFGKEFSSREEAVMVYDKAQQVSSVTYKFVTTAKQLSSQLTVGAISSSKARDRSKAALLKQFPNMEELFGSLDYCECEHCRSVLSPAAYFVDLLQLLDNHGPKKIVWDRFLIDWSNSHSGKAYDGPDYRYKNPYDALSDRRPDLPNLQLTCENTNVAMPYIDITNEILEYYVANKSLLPNPYETGSATTPELLAEPQNILPRAYDELKVAKYPIGLPFDLWLETNRQFFNYFDTPLWQALETFGSTDKLFTLPTDPNKFNLATIWSEYLGISPDEYNLFTNNNFRATWYELYGYTSEAQAFTELKSAKTLSRKLGISYKELTELIQTNFVNPDLNVLIILSKLEVSVEDVLRFYGQVGYPAFTSAEQADFQKKLTDAGPNVQTQLATLWLNNGFHQILILADPNTGSNFDLVTLLRVADRADFSAGTDVYTAHSDDYALAFLKLNLLVRLSQKLGWSVADVDRALQVFIPTSSVPFTPTSLGPVLKTVLVYIAHLKKLDDRFQLGKDSKQKLLSIWHPLFTTGQNPLYTKLFLVRSILKNDPIFDDALGNYLAQDNLKISGHLTSLQSALSLTATEIDEILLDNGQATAEAILSMDSVSLLYRYKLLAKALGLSIHELIVLKALSGLNPFAPLNANPLIEMGDDSIFNQILKFVEMADAVKSSGFHIEDIDYLFRHQFDSVGKYKPNSDELWNLVKALTTEIQQLRSEHAIPTDPMSFTDEILQQKLALIFSADVVRMFMAHWAETIKVRTSEETAAPSDPDLTDLSKYLEQSTIGKQLTGFLSTVDLTELFKPISQVPQPPNAEGLQNSQEEIKVKRNKLAQSFLPFLQKNLIQQLVIQTIAITLKSEQSLIETLLTNTDLLSEPNHTDRPLVSSFMEVEASGISVIYTGADNAILPGDFVQSINTSVKPNGAAKVHFDGYIQVQKTGVYQFSLSLKGETTTAVFGFSHLPNPFIVGKNTATVPESELNEVIELKAGRPYAFTLDATGLDALNAEGLNIGHIDVQVQSEGLPKGSLGRLKLYPQSSIDRVRSSMIVLTKTIQLIQGLGLSEREVRYFLTYSEDFDNLNLSLLPIEKTAPGTSTAIALLQQFLRLSHYNQLKQTIAGGSDALIDIFENARRIFPASDDATVAGEKVLDNLCQKLAKLTRRSLTTVTAACTHLNFTHEVTLKDANQQITVLSFTNEKGIDKLWQVLQILERLGVSIESISPLITATPNAIISRDLRNTLKARYEEEIWQRIAQPIFDLIRQHKRDGLVAYVMHNHPEGFQNVNQLFEYFLIDPEMEPVVRTSRLRLAISSVQLFIQRCLLNLEKSVHPSAINTKNWQWMKRYRVWEANRKIFLFPENWLEPEFRDDKTHLFQELEGSLLQGDVSNDLAEDAFFNYLKKLDELARLEMVTMYLEEHPDPAQNILHVIGRSYNLPHKYFYRRYSNSMWTPWEPVNVDISGDHIVAVIWHGRLNLFWLTFLEKAKSENTGTGKANTKLTEVSLNDIVEASSGTVKKIVEVQLNWSECFQGQWSSSGSSGFGNPINKSDNSNFDRRKVSMHVSKEIKEGREYAVYINFFSRFYPYGENFPTCVEIFTGAFCVVSKNSQPELTGSRGIGLYSSYNSTSSQVNKFKGDNNFQVEFVEKNKTENNQREFPRLLNKSILKKSSPFSLLLPSNPDLYASEIPRLTSPFFYEDNQHIFFVEPSLTITKTLIEWDNWVSEKGQRLPRAEMESVIHRASVLATQVYIDQTTALPTMDVSARHHVLSKQDWVSNPATIIEINDRLIGEKGSIDRSALFNRNMFRSAPTSLDGAATNVAATDIATVTPNIADVLRSTPGIDPGNVLQLGDQIHIIGNGGLRMPALNSLNQINSRISSRLDRFIPL